MATPCTPPPTCRLLAPERWFPRLSACVLTPVCMSSHSICWLFWPDCCLLRLFASVLMSPHHPVPAVMWPLTAGCCSSLHVFSPPSACILILPASLLPLKVGCRGFQKLGSVPPRCRPQLRSEMDHPRSVISNDGSGTAFLLPKAGNARLQHTAFMAWRKCDSFYLIIERGQRD